MKTEFKGVDGMNKCGEAREFQFAVYHDSPDKRQMDAYHWLPSTIDSVPVSTFLTESCFFFPHNSPFLFFLSWSAEEDAPSAQRMNALYDKSIEPIINQWYIMEVL
jgi:hypothetical protein